MKNSEYWEERSNERLSEYHKDSNETIDIITKAYDKAAKDIEKEISKIFYKYAKDGKLSDIQARKFLNTKISVKELEDIRSQINDIKDESIKKELLKKLNAPAYKARITRLEALKQDIYIKTKLLADIEIRATTSRYIETIKKAYYRAIFDIQKGLGLGFNVASMSSKTIKAILQNPWSGRHFSKRIWDNTEYLAEKLTEILTAGFMSGKSASKITKELESYTQYGKYAAERLVRTETTYMANAAEMESYKECEIDKYKYLATLDLRTSDICQSLDGKVFKVAKGVAGKNLPPMHPHCRSTTIAYFDSKIMEDLKRRARDPKTGKTYLVPDSMTYEQWYQKYVVDKYGKDQAEIIKKMIKNEASDKKQYERYKDVLGKEMPISSFDDFQDLKYNRVDEWTVLKGNYRKINAYNKIITNEPAITEDLMEIAQLTNTKLVGLNYRLKSKDSYLRKINADSKNSIDFQVIDETIQGTGDVIRYTYQGTSEKLVEKYFNINKELESRGYQQTKLKNTWLLENSTYKGVNCNYVTAEGQKFEVQYHTPQSFELKNGKLHKLYEEWRLIEDKSSAKAIKLAKEMAKLSKSLKPPLDIDKLR